MKVGDGTAGQGGEASGFEKLSRGSGSGRSKLKKMASAPSPADFANMRQLPSQSSKQGMQGTLCAVLEL